MFFISCISVFGQDRKTVAVVPATGQDVRQSIKDGITEGLLEGVVKSRQFRPVARDIDFEKALSEMKFQQGGAVADNQLIQFGRALRADLVCYASVNQYSEREFRISYKMIDVASGEILDMSSETVRDGISGLLTATDNIAKKLFGGSVNTGTSGGGSSSGSRHPAEPEMVFVQGGTFWMGCTGEQQGDCDSDESPLHQVTVSSFQIAKFVVTQKQWQLIMGTNVRQQRDKANSSWSIYGEGDNYPMYYVSWDEAQEFIRRLNAATGKQYRLPTEAEWEYAARGGAKSQGYKYSGSNNLNNVAWYTDNSGSITHAVGTKQPNELGIYDMSGNVWEWCNDWFGTYPASAQRDPMGASSGSFRVNRGGSWYNDATSCRVAYRLNFSPGFRYNFLGFRVVLP